VVPSGPTLPVCTPSSFLTSSQTCRGEGRGVRGPKVVAAHNAFWGGMRPLRDQRPPNAAARPQRPSPHPTWSMCRAWKIFRTPFLCSFVFRLLVPVFLLLPALPMVAVWA
jgi:hypothetical protein